MVRPAIRLTAVRVSIFWSCCPCATDFVTNSAMLCSPSQKFFKPDQRASRTTAIKPGLRRVKQLDDSINDSVVSRVRKKVSLTLIDFQDQLNIQYESVGDTIVQLRGAFSSG
jgi:hypothetical protein